MGDEKKRYKISQLSPWYPAITDNPLWHTPHYYGHHTNADNPMLETPHYYEHHTITDNPLLQTPHYYGHPTIMDTTLLRTPRYYGHPTITDTPLLPADTPLLRTPRYCGNPAVKNSPLLWTLQYYGNLTITDTPHYDTKTLNLSHNTVSLHFFPMSPVFHLVWSTCRATKTFVMQKVERGSTLTNKFWFCSSFFIKLTTCRVTNLLVPYQINQSARLQILSRKKWHDSDWIILTARHSTVEWVLHS